MTYNRNSSITSLTHTGNSQAGYGNMDFLSYSYTGNRLKAITDLGSSNVHDGAFEFVNGANTVVEYYYLRDHLGNNRLVISETGNIEQTNEYYPYGGPWGNASTNQGLQPFKYNGKELDRVHGLDWYDYGARWSTGSGPVPGMTLININTSLGYEAFKQELQVGDVLVWRNSGHGHAAIYVEGDTVVHASAHAYKKVVKAAVIRHFISEYGAYPKIYRLP